MPVETPWVNYGLLKKDHTQQHIAYKRPEWGSCLYVWNVETIEDIFCISPLVLSICEKSMLAMPRLEWWLRNVFTRLSVLPYKHAPLSGCYRLISILYILSLSRIYVSFHGKSELDHVCQSSEARPDFPQSYYSSGTMWHGMNVILIWGFYHLFEPVLDGMIIQHTFLKMFKSNNWVHKFKLI